MEKLIFLEGIVVKGEGCEEGDYWNQIQGQDKIINWNHVVAPAGYKRKIETYTRLKGFAEAISRDVRTNGYDDTR